MRHVHESHARDLHGELSRVLSTGGPETAVSIKGAGVLKRSGIKPSQNGALPDADSDSNLPLKPIRLSLDDPDAGIQVGSWDNQDRSEDFLADFGQTLLEAERLVLHQIVEPNELSMRLAEASRPEHFRARTVLSRISTRHLAAGIGMPHQAFSEIASRIRAKCRKFVRQ